MCLALLLILSIMLSTEYWQLKVETGAPGVFSPNTACGLFADMTGSKHLTRCKACDRQYRWPNNKQSNEVIKPQKLHMQKAPDICMLLSLACAEKRSMEADLYFSIMSSVIACLAHYVSITLWHSRTSQWERSCVMFRLLVWWSRALTLVLSRTSSAFHKLLPFPILSDGEKVKWKIVLHSCSNGRWTERNDMKIKTPFFHQPWHITTLKS